MKKRSVYIAILALVLVSCERENDLPTTPAALSFIPSVSGEALTKAAPYEGTAFPREISMGLMACSYTDSHAQPSTWTMHTSPSVVEAVHDGSRGEASEKWVPTTRVLWPGSGYVRFFAYAPFGAEGLSVTASDGTAPQLNFTVNADYSKQVDLLVANEASTRQYDGKPPVTEIDIPMTFNHVLTGIRFRVENGLAISSISVEGVYDKASLNLAAGGHNWIPDESSSGTYTLVSPSLKDDPSRTGFQVVDDVYTLLLLPQTLPAGARIVAEATNAVGSKTITALMAGEIWEPGKIITYTIAENAQMESIPSYTYSITATPPSDLTYAGNSSSSASVSSYRTNDETGEEERVPWSVAGYYSDPSCSVPYDGSHAGNRPAWITSVTESGVGSLSETAETVNIQTTASPSSTRTQSIATLISEQIAANGFRGSSERPYNLSNPQAPYTSDVQETANCYIVNACGCYRIPLVMGNGIVNNVVNPSGASYQGASGSSSVLFQDYTGQNVTHPFLHKSSSGAGTPSEAFVVWETVDGLIKAGTGYSLSDAFSYDSERDLWWLSFEVDKAQQGNAVIAVADASGNVMWSWHIWVTNYVPRKDPAYASADVTVKSDYDSGNYTLMPMNLGWLPSGSATAQVYAPRTVYLLLEQEGGASAVMAVSQAGHTAYTAFPSGGTGPYWQFGRKDPMLPNLTCYGRYPTLLTLTAQQTLGSAIKNPHRFIATGASSCWSNLSSPGNLWRSTAKTIYDPCPAGYAVPTLAAITLAFNSWPEDNASGSFSQGWYFYDSARTGTVFFPAAGVRSEAAGTIGSQGSQGFYWCDAIRTDGYGGQGWDFDSQWAFTDATARSLGRSIRPLQR